MVFFLADMAPTWVHPISALDEVVFNFGGDLPDPIAAPAFVEVVDSGGSALVAAPFVANGELHIPAPAGGWPQGASIRVHEQLPSVTGLTLPAPVIIPLQVN